MSTEPQLVQRHALGLPAGSVRAMLVLGIVGLICAIVLMPIREGADPKGIPPYLIYLLFIMLGHYFAAHGVTIATRSDPAPSPLHLPGGMIRTLVIIALFGSIGWRAYTNLPGLETLSKRSLELLGEQPYVPLAILAGFFLGVMLRSIVRRHPPRALQDFEAWFALIALLGLFIAAMIHLVVAPSVEHDMQIPTWDACLGAVIAFYFGERS